MICMTFNDLLAIHLVCRTYGSDAVSLCALRRIHADAAAPFVAVSRELCLVVCHELPAARRVLNPALPSAAHPPR